MFRNAIDRLMDYQVTPILIVLAYCGTLLWATAFRKGIKPALIVNLLVAAGILAYNLEDAGRSIPHDDYVIMSLVGFELIALFLSIGVLAGIRVPTWIVWAAIGINFLLAIALLAFLLLFKITRLI